MNQCAFIAIESGWRCTACGRVIRQAARSAKPPMASCLLNEPRAAVKPPPRPRPGDDLTAILRDWLGITSSAKCGCASMADRMNALGPDWCESEDGLAEIIGVMRAEHTKRKSAGQTRLPWSNLAATKLVRLACRRSRSKAPRVD